MSQEHELEKHRLSKGSDKSLTVSELNDLVADAVEEAIAPLQERIRQLESGSEDVVEESVEEPRQLERASRRLELDDLDFADDSSEDRVSSRKRVR